MSMIPNNVGLPVRDIALITDIFGRLRVSNPFTLFDSKLLYDSQSFHWDDAQVSGSSTSSTYNSNRSSVTIQVNGSVSGRRVRQSRFRPYYQPGKSQLIMVTTIVGTAPTGITKRWGCFDDKNGLYFEYSNNELYVCKRTYTSGSPVDLKVHQSNWNKEKLDSRSSFGTTLDPTKGNIYFISFEWLGLGDVQFGVIIDTQFIVLHQMKHSNTEDRVYMTTPNLPIRYEIISNGTGSSSSSMEVVCASVLSEGGINPTGTIRTIDRGSTTLSTASNTNIHPLIVIRLKPGAEGALIVPIMCDIVCTTNGPFRWSLQHNPTISGSMTFVNHPTANFQYCVTTSVSNQITTEGTTILSGYGIDKGSTIEITDMPISTIMGTDIQGNSDIYALAVNSVTDKINTFYASLTLRDIH